VIPLQDVIAPRTTPIVSRALLLVASIAFVVLVTLGVAPVNTIGLGINILYLWIFGDNVEDRLGHVWFAMLVTCGLAAGVGAHIAMQMRAAVPLAVPSAVVGAVLGAYFVLYPRSKVLTLVPMPELLHEIPAVFYGGLFLILHIPGGLPILGQVAAGLCVGAALCLLRRRPIVWSDA
jgi:membrane associated rhomboid family serine protease